MPTITDFKVPPGTPFSTPGSESLPVAGDTTTPEQSPRATVLVVHGYTGHKDRNIVPVAATFATELGCVTHRYTLAHAGIDPNADRITRHAEFTRDRLDYAVEDTRAVIRLIESGDLPGSDLPLIVIGHSRGAAQAIRIAATAHRENWRTKPAGIVCLAPPSDHTRFPEREQRELAEHGFVERACERADGGTVKLGPTWFAHHFDEAGNRSPVNVLAGDIADCNTPALIIHGTADDAVGLEHADTLEELFKARAQRPAAFHRIDDADHNFSAKGTTQNRLVHNPDMTAQIKHHLQRFLDEHLR